MSENEESSTNPSTSPAISTPSHEEIANRAYLLWMTEGYPEGHDTDHWHQAEAQLRAEYSATVDRSLEAND
jgi:hypothetical protein